MRRLLVGLLLVSGCSLPLPDGVKSVAGVQAEQARSGEALQVIPPGPKDGQTPREVVIGFLQAQANAVDRHAIARSFLTDAQARSWDDRALVRVYDLGSIDLAGGTPDGGDQAAVEVTSRVTGIIGADGGYEPWAETATEAYRLQRIGREWRLSSVPVGVRLTAADRDRSFRATNVFYLGQTPAAGSPRLVPDRVFLPTGRNFAQRLVERVLQKPSAALSGSVAHTPGLQVERVDVDGAGLVTVDLAASARDLAPAARRDLSAQLIWTLRGLGLSFTGLRLRSGGEALRVPGEGDVQDDGAWDSYDPEGLGPNPPYFYVSGRRLRSNGIALPSNPATAGDVGGGQAIAVDAVAVTPDRTQVALLEGTGPGRVTVRTGPLRGPTYRTALTATDLRSPSFGSGDRGLWMVQRQRDVVILAPGARGLLTVPISGRPAGALTSLAASRDGARVALVLGQRLYVARVEASAQGPRLVGLRPIVPTIAVSDVAWTTGTELALIGRTRIGQPQVMRVALDGSALESLNTVGLLPTQVTGVARGLVLSVGDLLYALVGRTPGAIGPGSAPAYPG